MARIQSAGNTSLLAIVTATFPQTPAQGNLLVAAVTTDVGVGVIAITGWTSAVSVNVGLTGGLMLFYKIAGINESTSVQSTATLATFMDLHIYEYSNIDVASPLSQTASTADSGVGVTSRSSGATTIAQNAPSLTFVAIAQTLVNGGNAVWTNNMALGITTTHLLTSDLVIFTSEVQSTVGSWTNSQRAAGVIATFLPQQGSSYRGGR